jgi:hypothetical protein
MDIEEWNKAVEAALRLTKFLKEAGRNQVPAPEVWSDIGSLSRIVLELRENGGTPWAKINKVS